MNTTLEQYDQVIEKCRLLFEKKSHDYGPSWRVLRDESVTDQIFIKVKRLRTVQITGIAEVDETPEDGFMAIVNYAIIGLIQNEIGASDHLDHPREETLERYDYFANEAKELMRKKNHDYGEAWRDMRINSMTDLIFQKILRVKQIEMNEGKTLASEGWEANYFDMLNYAVFCLIKLSEENA